MPDIQETADELQEIISELFDIAGENAAEDVEDDRLSRLLGRSAMLVARLRRQAEVASMPRWLPGRCNEH